jgi:hypothetical protein
MRDRFTNPDDTDHAIAHPLPTSRQFAREVIEALRQTVAVQRSHSATGERR